MSFLGERVEIKLDPTDEGVQVSVTSEQSRGQFLDLGRRNQKNVGNILNTMETKLRSRLSRRARYRPVPGAR